MEKDQFDYFDAPQYFDFANDVVPDDIDNFFEAGYRQQSRRASSLPPRSVKTVVAPAPFSPAMQEDLEDKENCGPSPDRHRSSSLPPEAKNPARVLADISYSSSTHLMTPRGSRKSQITFLDNGRSVRVQKYEGIQLITPNKSHPMETRLDLVINSPGLNLRSRSVTKKNSRVTWIDTITESKTEKQDDDTDVDPVIQCDEMEYPTSVEANAEEPASEAEPAQAVRGRSVVILPTQLATQAPAIVPAALKPEIVKPKRIQHTAPMVAQFRPVSAVVPVASKAKADKGVFRTTAELVRNFHRATPDRFHSKPANHKPPMRRLPSPVGPRPNTIPKSPFMTLKSRVRVENIPSQADKDKAELEEMKKHQIKAKPVPRQILIPPVQKNIGLAKIQPTKPSPFKLTQLKRKEMTPEPVFRFKANPVPRRLLQSPQGVPPKQEIPLTEPVTPALTISAKYPKRPKLDGIDLNAMGHGGVIRQVTPGKLTQVQPFSFEERDKDYQSKRLDLIQKQLEHEKRAREFHARKLPNFDRAPLLPEKKLMPVTVPHTPQLSTFVFGVKNKQKFYEKLAEEEQRMQDAVIFKAKPATVTHAEPFKPVLPHRVITDTTLVPELHLYTEKRAAERAKFDEMLREQEKTLEENRQELEKLMEEEARQEVMQIRKEAEFHANPVRKGTPMKIKPSDRPLTETATPKFMTYERLGRPKQ